MRKKKRDKDIICGGYDHLHRKRQKPTRSNRVDQGCWIQDQFTKVTIISF